MRMIPDWIAEDIAAQGQTLPAEAVENMVMLRDYAVRMDATLDALTELSRVGRLSDPIATHDLQAIVRAVCAGLPDLPAIECGIACDGVAVSGPENDLHKLFAALVHNVAAHHDRKAGTLRVEARVSNERVHVTVSDDGPGIPDQQLEAVFKPLTALRPKSETGHCGVGLAIARKVVRNLGGDIQVEPNGATRGCCLRFDLPQAPAQG